MIFQMRFNPAMSPSSGIFVNIIYMEFKSTQSNFYPISICGASPG